MRSFLSNAPKTPILRRIWRHTDWPRRWLPKCWRPPTVCRRISRTSPVFARRGPRSITRRYPSNYAALATRTHENTKSILDAERTQFGLDHCQAGQILGESCIFPASCNWWSRVIWSRLRAGPAVAGADRLPVGGGSGIFRNRRQDHQTKPIDTIEAYVPTAIRGHVVETMKDIDQRIIDRLESLDF